MSEHPIIASGGWCAPTSFAMQSLPKAPLTLPEAAVTRGGISFEPPSAAEQAANSAMRALVARIVEYTAKLRHEAIDAACLDALATGMDVHVYEPPPVAAYSWSRPDDTALLRLRCVGIAFTPAEHPIPTIHYHPAPDMWDDEEDW